MGTELIVNGTDRDYEDDTTVAELKREEGIPINDIVTYIDENGEMKAISDEHAVDEMPDKARVSSHPDAEFGQ